MCTPGSSPLARGTPAGIRKDPPTHGLIPARAGNTAPPTFVKKASRAHPRSRGEHVDGAHAGCWVGGSSPLARGTLGIVIRVLRVRGLIPARAGNTVGHSETDMWAGAHPRSRGEHCSSEQVRSLPLGSSPLARGTLTLICSLLVVPGLIPARAGNT